MGSAGPAVNQPDGVFQQTQILRLYHRLYPLIAQDFRHIVDCSLSMAEVLTWAETHTHIGAPIVGGPTSPPVLPPPPTIIPDEKGAISFITAGIGAPPYAVRVGDPFLPPPLQLPGRVPVIPGGV